ncbi:S41 family peptidase [Chitiniphilus purpureus]|uniref:S41 family peptidase n=1 Tax=Chitiniphilus purpureus TaxID=2981137 RepID=A0ABY6DLR2_9NEIS|nr:S41 family peptidase [Chitiniphilus sp. CD1]UXY15310.1 S41 family peptidase [Chitiniphilus sp. CD1]
MKEFSQKKQGWLYPARRWASLMVLGAGLAGCGGEEGEPPLLVQAGDVVQDGRIDARLVGNYRVLGEGWLVTLTEEGLQRYQEAQTLCYPHPERDSPQVFSGYRFRRTLDPKQSRRVELYAMPGLPASYSLERIDGIPAHCLNPAASSPARTFQAMWEMLQLDYAFFNERGIDWPARHAQYAGRAAAAADDEALGAVLSEALGGFKDEHVALIQLDGNGARYRFIGGDTPTLRMLKAEAEAEAEAPHADGDALLALEQRWRAQLQERVVKRLEQGSAVRAFGDGLIWGRLPGNVGYLAIGRLSEFRQGNDLRADVEAAGQEVDRVLAALADTKAMIVDVSLLLEGGHDAVGLEIAGRFADQRRLAFTKIAHRPQGVDAQSWYIAPKGERQYRKPVYLLTSDRTVSAGDTFALAMRELPQVTLVGQPTSGALSNALTKRLPGNFAVVFANEIYRDARGEVFEVRGVPPALPMTLFDPARPASLYTGHEEALSALLGRIGPEGTLLAQVPRPLAALDLHRLILGLHPWALSRRLLAG